MIYTYNNNYRPIQRNIITFKGDNYPSRRKLDISSRAPYPACTLSNFAPTNFELDGVQINSMEGFIQSLKVADPERQKEICQLSGLEAKNLSKTLTQSKDDELYFWQGKSFKQSSEEYNALIKDVTVISERTPNQPFEYKGYNIYSVSSFITALKSKNEEKQKKLCTLSEDQLKTKMQKVKIQYSPRILYWQGKKFSRDSKEYSDLLDRAYKARFDADEKFRHAIHETQTDILTHRKGGNNPSATILTADEFLSHLKALRLIKSLK